MQCINKVNKTCLNLTTVEAVYTEEADTYKLSSYRVYLCSSSCAENFSLKFMHDVIMPVTAMHTWCGCYDGGLLVVKH